MADAPAPPPAFPPNHPPRRRPVVLFDGDCAFCNASVLWIIRRDPRGNLLFAPLASPLAASLLADFPAPLPDSMAVVEWTRADASAPPPAPTVHFRSDATLAILRHLSRPWSVLRFASLIPRPLRDACYDLVARRRRRLARAHNPAGPSPASSTVCVIPDPVLRSRVITSPDQLDP